jgi:conjugative transfer pilus assembly protein TraH
MLGRIRQRQEASREAYIAAAGEITTIMTYLEKMQKIETQMVSEITRRYGKDTASRMQL